MGERTALKDGPRQPSHPRNARMDGHQADVPPSRGHPPCLAQPFTHRRTLAFSQSVSDNHGTELWPVERRPMLDFAQARRMMVDGQLRTFDVNDLPLLAAMD